jgi:transcriptional regulator with GAF, ATPase, and Fis domain
VDVRIVAATNRDLEAEVAAGRFRRDLFFRIVGVRVVLPPLRERIEDIPLLASALLDRIADEAGMRRARLSRQAMTTLLRYHWPGNVRELEQTLRRAVLLAEGEEIRPGDLALTAAASSRREAIRGFDRQLVVQSLRAAQGNRSAAARGLGVSRSTLHRWIRRYGLS